MHPMTVFDRSEDPIMSSSYIHAYNVDEGLPIRHDTISASGPARPIIA